MTGRDRPRSKAYHLDSPLVEGSAYKVREFCQLPAVLVVTRSSDAEPESIGPTAITVKHT